MNRQIVDEAAEWFVEINTGATDPDTRRRFDQWLRASPTHLEAYLRMLPFWENAEGVSSPDGLSAEQLISRARSGSNIHSLIVSPASAPDALPAPVRRRMRWRLSAMAALVCTAALIAGLGYITDFPTYTTQVGEQRSLELPDGSIVELNALSKIHVHFSAGQRTVELLQGQALFRVSKDPVRPFVVDSLGARIRAVGTQFDVDQRSSGTTVTVLEGKVAVWPGDETRGFSPPTSSTLRSATTISAVPGELLLGVGDQVTVRANQALHPAKADLATVTAWRQRQLVFNKAHLRDVAEEFNRYNTRSLRIVDQHLQELVVSGVFSSTDVEPLVRFLRAQPGVRVVESPLEIRVTAQSAASR